MEFEIGDLTDDGEDDRGGHGWHGGRLKGHLHYVMSALRGMA